jgi:hypothetical protein
LIEGLQQLPEAVREREAVVQTIERGEVQLTVELTDVEITDTTVVLVGDLDKVG